MRILTLMDYAIDGLCQSDGIVRRQQKAGGRTCDRFQTLAQLTP